MSWMKCRVCNVELNDDNIKLMESPTKHSYAFCITCADNFRGLKDATVPNLN